MHFSHDDVAKLWTYRIELGARTGKVFLVKHYVELPVDGYLLRRHQDWGEIANHRWYSKYFGAEYQYPWSDKSITAPRDKYLHPSP